MILKGAEPFFFPGGSHGVLLIHGFTGLPADLLLMGQYLRERGHSVLGVRLAGHGTSVEDMSRMTAEDWMDSARDGYAILSGCSERISVAGHSMGGLIALLLASRLPVHRVVTMAAPIVIAEESGIALLPPREISEGQYVPKPRRHLKNVPMASNATYRKMPLVSVHEMLDILERAKAALPYVKAPLLALHSREDHTAAPESAAYIHEHAGSAEKEIAWFAASGHLLPLDAEREEVFRRTAEFLGRG